MQFYGKSVIQFGKALKDVYQNPGTRDFDRKRLLVALADYRYELTKSVKNFGIRENWAAAKIATANKAVEDLLSSGLIDGIFTIPSQKFLFREFSKENISNSSAKPMPTSSSYDKFIEAYTVFVGALHASTRFGTHEINKPYLEEHLKKVQETLQACVSDGQFTQDIYERSCKTYDDFIARALDKKPQSFYGYDRKESVTFEMIRRFEELATKECSTAVLKEAGFAVSTIEAYRKYRSSEREKFTRVFDTAFSKFTGALQAVCRFGTKDSNTTYLEEQLKIILAATKKHTEAGYHFRSYDESAIRYKAYIKTALESRTLDEKFNCSSYPISLVARVEQLTRFKQLGDSNSDAQLVSADLFDQETIDEYNKMNSPKEATEKAKKLSNVEITNLIDETTRVFLGALRGVKAFGKFDDADRAYLEAKRLKIQDAYNLQGTNALIADYWKEAIDLIISQKRIIATTNDNKYLNSDTANLEYLNYYLSQNHSAKNLSDAVLEERIPFPEAIKTYRKSELEKLSDYISVAEKNKTSTFDQELIAAGFSTVAINSYRKKAVTFDNISKILGTTNVELVNKIIDSIIINKGADAANERGRAAYSLISEKDRFSASYFQNVARIFRNLSLEQMEKVVTGFDLSPKILEAWKLEFVLTPGTIKSARVPMTTDEIINYKSDPKAQPAAHTDEFRNAFGQYCIELKLRDNPNATNYEYLALRLKSLFEKYLILEDEKNSILVSGVPSQVLHAYTLLNNPAPIALDKIAAALGIGISVAKNAEILIKSINAKFEVYYKQWDSLTDSVSKDVFRANYYKELNSQIDDFLIRNQITDPNFLTKLVPFGLNSRTHNSWSTSIYYKLLTEAILVAEEAPQVAISKLLAITENEPVLSTYDILQKILPKATSKLWESTRSLQVAQLNKRSDTASSSSLNLGKMVQELNAKLADTIFKVEKDSAKIEELTKQLSLKIETDSQARFNTFADDYTEGLNHAELAALDKVLSAIEAKSPGSVKKQFHTGIIDKDGSIAWNKPTDNLLNSLKKLENMESHAIQKEGITPMGKTRNGWIEDDSGTQKHYKDGKIHQDSDEPAELRANGTKGWYKNGLLNRDGQLPAFETAGGTLKYAVKGEYHRLGGLPAIVWGNAKNSHKAIQEWWEYGKIKSIEYADGTLKFFAPGATSLEAAQLHRTDGPAVITSAGELYYLFGKKYADQATWLTAVEEFAKEQKSIDTVFMNIADNEEALENKESKKETSKGEKKMSEMSFTDKLKMNAKNAAIRVAADQGTNLVRNTLVGILRKQGMDEGKMGGVVAFLDSNIGKGILEILAGIAGAQFMKDNEKFQLVANELQTSGMTVIGNAVAGELMNLLPQLMEVVKAIPDSESETNSNVRVIEEKKESKIVEVLKNEEEESKVAKTRTAS